MRTINANSGTAGICGASLERLAALNDELGKVLSERMSNAVRHC